MWIKKSERDAAVWQRTQQLERVAALSYITSESKRGVHNLLFVVEIEHRFHNGADDRSWCAVRVDGEGVRNVYERDLVLEQKRDQNRRISRRAFELGANLGARNNTFARTTVGIETSTESQSVMTVMCDLLNFGRASILQTLAQNFQKERRGNDPVAAFKLMLLPSVSKFA